MNKPKIELDKNTEKNTLTALSLIGLVCLLVYTFVHTGGILASFIAPPFVGYIAAFGIELLIAVTSWRLGKLRKAQTANNFLVFVLSSSLLISAMANISEGYKTKYGQELSWANIPDIDILQWIVAILSTGLISVLVFAVSEIIGSDVQAIVRGNTFKSLGEQEPVSKSDKPEQERVQAAEQQTDHEQAELDGQTDFSQSVFALLDRYKAEEMDIPGPTEIARTLGCSKGTASKWAAAWAKQRTNGVNS